jgi:GT2 family glycosyltransferase
VTSSPHERPDRLAVVVVNYRSHALLEVNLRPLAQAVPEALVVVVDNYSSDAERAAIERLARENGWHPVLSPVNGGFGAGMNAGARRALERGARSLLLLNPDATLDAESLHRLHRRVQEEPDTLVAPVISRGDGSVWFDGVDLYLDRGRMRATRKRQPADSHRVEQWLTGACLAISAPMWERLGGFDEDYFLYWEDVDLSHRARLAGGRLLVDRDARAVHDEGATHDAATGAQASGQPKSTTYYYYNIRNRLLYAAKHLSPRDRRRWALTAVPAAVEILLQGGRRQFRHPLGPLGAAWRGSWDGLVAMRRHARHRRDAGAPTEAPGRLNP